jgi:hypothetical protein
MLDLFRAVGGGEVQPGAQPFRGHSAAARSASACGRSAMAAHTPPTSAAISAIHSVTPRSDAS